MTREEALDQLEKGHEYEIVWRIEGVQRRDRKSRMSYLGLNETLNELEFNARPAAGTQVLRPENIKSVKDLGPSIGRDDSRRYVGAKI